MRPGRRLRGQILTATTYILLLACCVVFLAPLAWMLSTSLKPVDHVFDLPIEWLPSDPRFANYPTALGTYDFKRYFVNSGIVAGTVTSLHVLLASWAGYGLAKYRFGGRQMLFWVILATLLLPLEVIMIPLWLTVKSLGWDNSYAGLIVPVVADAFGVLLMRQYFLALPNELIDASRIDGAGHLRSFFTIAVPNAWPAIVTLAIFIFQATWDEFVWPFLIVSSSDMKTVPLGVQAFQAGELSNFPAVMAVSTVATIPLATLFLVFQRYWVRGVATSGIRG
jgi:ABC-type glycerol-3-phosphate transport system permease component